MATVKQLEDAAAIFVNREQRTAFVGIYETDEGSWLSVYYGGYQQKEALDLSVFGRVLVPDETEDNGAIEIYCRHFLS